MIKIIVAYDKNRLIGNGDKLPWSIKEDLEHFKNETINKTILFGDITFNGIGHPLPDRKTIVLTLDKKYKFLHPNVKICNDINDIITKYSNVKNNEIIIAGGATIYKLFLPFADEIILSEIKGEYYGDVYFPEWDIEKFNLVSKKEKNEFIIKKFVRK